MPAARSPARSDADISGYKRTGPVWTDDIHLQRWFCLEQMHGEPQGTPRVCNTTNPNATAVTR